jgi:hypothetical protein
MRILQLTGGAAGMYCGTCLRDNVLAATLIKQGHDVTLLPLYTPTMTDEPNVSNDHIFFGGISVYLEQHWSLFRKTPWLLDKAVGFENRAQSRRETQHLRRSAFPRRDDDFHARSRARTLEERTAEDVALARRRAATRRRQSPVYAARRARRAVERDTWLSHRVHAARRGSVHRRP